MSVYYFFLLTLSFILSNMVYVITGGPGFGKTTLINLLQKKGYSVCGEGARALIAPEVSREDRNEIVQIPLNFEQNVACLRIEFLQSVNLNTIAFSDRGLPDQIAFSRYKGKIPSEFIQEAVLSNRYGPFVFITPPWEAIFTTDEVRKESFAEALLIHSQIVRAYLEYGYRIIDIPLTGPEKRMEFILNFLGI
jgi:predicted ATPase